MCLVIIDSVSFQFRHFEASFSERTRLLMSISKQLSELVHGRNLAVSVAAFLGAYVSLDIRREISDLKRSKLRFKDIPEPNWSSFCRVVWAKDVALMPRKSCHYVGEPVFHEIQSKSVSHKCEMLSSHPGH